MSRFCIIVTIKVSSFAYYKKANFLPVLCLRPHYFTSINLELIRDSLWQPRFHAGILVQEIKICCIWNYGIDLDGVHIPYCLPCHELSLCQIWCFYLQVHNSCKILHESAGLYNSFLFSSLVTCLCLQNRFAPTTCKRSKPQLFNLFSA